MARRRQLTIIRPLDPTFRFVVDVQGNDLVVSNVVCTWFGGPHDKSDDGSTASGISTRDHPNLVGCALPMNGCHSRLTDGSPLPRLPWWTLVNVTNLSTGDTASVPLIDLGPSKYARSHAAIDLTEAAFRLLGGDLKVGSMRVDFSVAGGAQYLPTEVRLQDDAAPLVGGSADLSPGHWIFAQSSGAMFHRVGTSVRLLALGYSGTGDGKNDPDEQCERDHGPIPRGRYTIEAPTTFNHMSFCLPLRPDPNNEMCGRSGFLIHDGVFYGPTGNSSLGCICLPEPARKVIWESGDRTLEVLREGPDGTYVPSVPQIS